MAFRLFAWIKNLDEKQKMRFIRWILICLGVVLISNRCMCTNTPDRFTSADGREGPVTAYQFLPDSKRSSYMEIPPEVAEDSAKLYQWEHYRPVSFDPLKSLRIHFRYPFYGYYNNDNYLEMWTYVYANKPYETIHIRKISCSFDGKSKILMADGTAPIKRLTQLLDENNEPFVLNGENYYFGNADLRNINYHVVNGLLWQEKTVELTVDYSFDDDPPRREIFKYEVVCGGRMFDPMRAIIWMYPP